MLQGASDKGYTLVEILIVVSILGIVALVAIPDFSSTTSQKLELAAAEVTQAIRFARSEAMRTGELRGVEATAAADRIRLYRVQTLIPPVFLYDIRHPVDKKIYDLQFQNDNRLDGVDISSVAFQYEGVALAVNTLFFSGSGTPLLPNPPGASPMLTAASITLGYRGDTRTIRVAPMTGRVTVQ